MCLLCPFGGRRSAVPTQHGIGLPAGQVHEVALLAALGKPLVGERVAEAVGVHVLDAGLR